MIALAGPLHPELVAAGLAAGIVAVAAAVATGRRELAPGVAATLGAAVLVAHDDVRAWLLGAIAVAALGPLVPAGAPGPWPRIVRGSLLVGGVALAVATVADATATTAHASVAFVAIAGLVVVGAVGPGSTVPSPTVGLAGRLGGALAIITVVGATWAGAPDTEGAVAVGAALAAPLLASVTLPARPGRPVTWAAALLLVVWAAADGYRGRPAGLTASVVAVAGLVTWLVHVRRGGRTGLVALALVGGWAGAMGVVARTAGLQHRAAAWAVALATCAALVALVAVARLIASGRGAVRTSPG